MAGIPAIQRKHYILRDNIPSFALKKAEFGHSRGVVNR
jgi:hypothetical protein